MSIRKLSKITVGEMIDLEVNFLGEINAYRMSLVQIGKHFLSHVLNINVFKLDFEEVKKLYVESSNKEDIPTNESEFYKSIVKDYLWLESEPKEKVLEYFYKATDDIKKIDLHLHYIDAELAKLEDSKKTIGWLNGGERYKRNLLEYYKDKNQVAKNEILEFLSENIESYAFSKCKKSLYSAYFSGFFGGEMPYRYSRGLFFDSDFDRYDVRNMTEMSNKFLDLPVPAYKKVKGLYENNQEEFYQFAMEYISGDLEGISNVIDRTHDYITKSHIINNRKDALFAIINHFRNKDYLSAVNMLPMQIEGVFHDVCLAVGIDESRLDISSINEKLRIIQKEFNNFIYFEYYSFKFPVMRNMIAHGKLIESNVEHTAIMLMLDLIPVFELSLSEEIPVNKKIVLLDKALKNDFDSLVSFFDYLDIEIPSFYNRESELEEIIKMYNRDEFWCYIEGKVKSEKIEKVNNSKIMKFVKKLNRTKLCKDKSKDFLKNMPILVQKMKEAELERNAKMQSIQKVMKKN